MFGSIFAFALFFTPIAALAETDTEVSDPDKTSGVTPQEWAQQCKPWDEWDKPAPPFRIYGDTYYVGTCGIASILVLGEEQHVLIDTGTERGTDVVIGNLETLKISPKSIDLLLYSHEHFDHVGGHAKFQRHSGAFLGIHGTAAIRTFKTGLPHPSDPQSGMHAPMETVPGEAFSLLVRVDGGSKPYVFGPKGTELTMIRTPGHSPGALSWQWESCENDVCKTIVYADSLSPVSADDYKFSDHPEYLEEYRKGIARVAALKCDILLTPHPSHSKMVERAAAGTFDGGMSCWEYAAGKMRDLDKRLAKEAAQ